MSDHQLMSWLTAPTPHPKRQMMRAPQLTLPVHGTAKLSWLVRWAPPRPQEMTGIRGRLWWGLLKLQMGADNVELACLSILNELSANCRENLKLSGCWG